MSLIKYRILDLTYLDVLQQVFLIFLKSLYIPLLFMTIIMIVGPLRVRTMCDHIWGKYATPQMGVNRQLQAKMTKCEIAVSQKL